MENLQEKKFWRQWLLIGAIGGMAGIGLLVFLLFLLAFLSGEMTRSSLIVGAAVIGLFGLTSLIPAGIYGCSQGIAQRLFLRSQTPKLRRSIQAHFSAIIVATIVTAGLLVALLFVENNFISEFSKTLISLGLPPFITAGFIVGGFGGIAQAIVTRFLLRSMVHDNYLHWILPLALWGHLSGGIAAAIGTIIAQRLIPMIME